MSNWYMDIKTETSNGAKNDETVIVQQNESVARDAYITVNKLKLELNKNNQDRNANKDPNLSTFLSQDVGKSAKRLQKSTDDKRVQNTLKIH